MHATAAAAPPRTGGSQLALPTSAQLVQVGWLACEFCWFVGLFVCFEIDFHEAQASLEGAM